jgi:peptide/nickel transport system substrate-binding protein
MRPVPGGIYTEGILGDFTTANPIFATNEVDTSVAKLVFAGLLKYNEQNQLVGNLAADWSVNEKGNVYTVNLKPNLKWHDGQPLTAEDVVFTYKVIQNPDAHSPLQSSWQGVTVAAHGSRQVTFSLPNALSSFPYELTTGIVPKHLLSHVAMADMRTAQFNTVNPIGAGPFAWKTLQVAGNTPATREEQIALSPSKTYNGGTPKLASFIIHAFHDQDRMLQSYKQHELTGMSGLSSVPPELVKDKSVHTINYPLMAAEMAFFKTSQGVLSDVHVRQALVQGADRQAIIKSLGYQTTAVDEPLLQGQLGYDPAYRQAGYDLAAAKALLDANGWKLNGQVRAKGKQPLRFALYTDNAEEDRAVAAQLAQQWKQLGAQVDVNAEDASTLQQVVSAHGYDALLYGIAIGPDPDVFAFWDSSQANPLSPNRLNLSEYKSTAADAALEAGRTRTDPVLRTVKYRPFLQAWQQDAPALGLYQPRYLYITAQPVYNLAPHNLNADSDRFYNVEDWEIHTAAVTND